jgi:hypothetical protein
MDAVARKTNDVITFKKSMYYDWLDEKDTQLHRGEALIFFDQYHEQFAEELGLSFQHLDYEIVYEKVENIKKVVGNILVCGINSEKLGIFFIYRQETPEEVPLNRRKYCYLHSSRTD